MAQLPYTKQMLIERVSKHLNNGFAHSSFPISDEEILLAIDAGIPFVMKGMMFENAKVSGVIDVPEGWLVTYNYTISDYNRATREYKITLAQPPLALPTGYDITNMYFSSEATGVSNSFYFIKVKRNPYRDLMPKPSGVSVRVDGQTMYLAANNGMPLLGFSFYVQMPISRTDDVNAPMNMPDDAIPALFDMVVKTMVQRYMIPKDIIRDNLPAGVKTS